MSTPFEFFRRNQKVALAAVTGMAILSFLVQDAISSSGERSAMGVAVLLVGSLAIVGWVWGAKEGKSGENAIFGAGVGIAMAAMFMFLGRPPAAMSASSGNLSTQAMNDRILNQAIANRMINLVYYRADSFRSMMEQFRPGSARPQFFEYGGDAKTNAVVSELLNREADELGIEITDDAIMNHLKEVAGKDRDGEENLTRQLFSDAVRDTVVSFQGRSRDLNEEAIFTALRHELRARQAANLLLGGSRLTPADVWDLHRKLSIRQSAQVVAIPVADFVKKDSQPSDSEALELFEKYKNNVANFTPPPQPKLEEGRPGFYLPRRMRIAYVEPNYEEIEKQVGEITEEEIQKRYEEQYKKEMPRNDVGDGLDLDMPILPSIPKKDPAVPAEEKPAEGDKPATPPAPPASESTDKPAAEAPAEKPSEPAKPEEPAAEPAKPAEEKPAEPAKPEGSSSLLRSAKFQPVALIQEAGSEKPAAESPAAEVKPEAPAETPSAEKPAAEAAPAADPKPADAPAAEKPAAAAESGDAPPPTTEKPADAPLTVPPVAPATDEDPAPPVSRVRPLDDALKAQIREELLNEKMQPLLTAKTEAARDFMNDIQLRVGEYLEHKRAEEEKRKSELSADAISPEVATEELKAYAKKHGLTYTETPLLSLQDLQNSDDYPVGGAMVREMSVTGVLQQSPTRDLYSARAAVRLGDNRANFAFWKIEDIEEHSPASIDEPGMKEMVTKAWRELQARPIAEKRAQALSEIVAKSDKPMAEALSEQTVTGGAQNESLFVTVTATGEFSWLQRNMLPDQFGRQEELAPRLGAVNGVQGAGVKFMTKAFDEMKPGDTAVIPNENLSIYYVVKIEKRTPATDAELESMKNSFLSDRTASLNRFAGGMAMSQDGNFLDRLFIKHGVKIAADRNSVEIDN